MCLKTKDYDQLIYTQGYKKGSLLQRNTLKAFFSISRTPETLSPAGSLLELHGEQIFSHLQHKLLCHFYSLNWGGMGQKCSKQKKSPTDSPVWGSLSLLSPCRKKIEILDLKQKELFQKQPKKNQLTRNQRVAVSNVTKLFTLQRFA